MWSLRDGLRNRFLDKLEMTKGGMRKHKGIRTSGNQVAGNQVAGNRVAENQVAENQVAGNQGIGGYQGTGR